METWILVGILLFLIFLIYSGHCDCRRGFNVGGITAPIMCNPNANPPQKCPGGKSCTQCGGPACPCPSGPS